MASQSRKHRGPGGNRMGTPEERLRGRLVTIETGCREYQGSRTVAGYGYMQIEGKDVYAHRLAYELENGPIPNGLVVCHVCDNPPCCHPGHLFVGTIADNNRDMWAKGRGRLTPPAWRKIPLECLPAIISRYGAGESKAEIAAGFGVTRQAIHYLLKREGAL